MIHTTTTFGRCPQICQEYKDFETRRPHQREATGKRKDEVARTQDQRPSWPGETPTRQQTTKKTRCPQLWDRELEDLANNEVPIPPEDPNSDVAMLSPPALGTWEDCGWEEWEDSWGRGHDL